MNRAYAFGTAASPPSIPANPAIGYPTSGNPASGTPPTTPGPYWYHMVTEEITTIVTAAGLTPTHTKLTQLKEALDLLYRPHAELITDGVAPSFTLTPAPPVTAYQTGQRFRIKFHATGVADERKDTDDKLNINGLGFKALKQYNAIGVKTAAVIVAGQLAEIEFDGTDFVVLTPTTTVPAGQIAYFAQPNPPRGWLKANGATLSRTQYSALFQAIGVTFGAGDAVTTFQIPDLRAEFIRGLDDGRGLDPDRGLGGWQDSQNRWHAHTGATANSGHHHHAATADVQGHHAHHATSNHTGEHTHALHVFKANDFNNGGRATGTDDVFDGGAWVEGSSIAGGHSHTITVHGTGEHAHNISIAHAGDHAHGIHGDGGTETRPRNVALLACIKY